jgi:glutaconyl-CoA/methylmalonyl-CoA decarboxylase subunit gamma
LSKYYVQIENTEIGLEVLQGEHGTEVHFLTEDGSAARSVDFQAVHSNVETGEGLYSLIVDGHSYQVHVERAAEGLRMVIGRELTPSGRIEIRVLTEREWRLQKVAPRQVQQSGPTTIKAPMPGLVKSVVVAEGQEVQQGQRLIVLEAMKMENDITAPRQARVVALHIAEGTTVESGKPLVTLEA